MAAILLSSCESEKISDHLLELDHQVIDIMMTEKTPIYIGRDSSAKTVSGSSNYIIHSPASSNTVMMGCNIIGCDDKTD